jgi:hypothetical protein
MHDLLYYAYLSLLHNVGRLWYSECRIITTIPHTYRMYVHVSGWLYTQYSVYVLCSSQNEVIEGKAIKPIHPATLIKDREEDFLAPFGSHCTEYPSQRR